MTPIECMWQEIRRNHGLIRSKRVAELGVPRGHVRHLLSRGILESVHRGLFASTGAPRSWHFDLSMGVQIAGAPDDPERIASAVCHLTAAVYQGLAGSPDRPIHILSTRYIRPIEGYEFHRTARLPEEEISVVDGIPTTDSMRTFLDIAATNPRRAEWIYLNARRRGDFTKEEALRRVMAESRPGRRGLSMGRHIVEKYDEDIAVTRSNSEIDVYQWIVDAGLPPPERNVYIPATIGDFDWEVDLLYREPERIAMDVSPSPTHGPEVFHKDNRKLNDLTKQGYRFLVITEETNRHEFIRTLRSLLEPPL